MKNLNPIQKAKYILDHFKQYITSTYYLQNDVYYEKFKKELDNTEILKGPYISRSLEFKTTTTINELITEGIVHKDFEKLGDIDLYRKLYKHQEEAIRLIHKKDNLIVTTGTGSGKTESFLYPIINEILHEENIDKPGIRAIFLFPMNALVNDQFDRVRKLLSKYPKIKYAYFTVDTKEKINNLENERAKIKKESNIEIKENELLDRQSIRNTPPHILFTNYSMLEYILLRPEDDNLLCEKNTKYWKFIVLDEAHTYKGALGIEIGMLMRKLLQRINKNDIQFILTSATLAQNNEEGIKKIQEFANKLTSKKFNNEDILFAEKIELNEEENAKYCVDPKDYENLYNNYNLSTLNNLLEKYGIHSNETSIENKLYDLIIHDKNLYRLNDLLEKQSKLLDDLPKEMKQYNPKFEIDSLSKFIDLICKCKKDSLKIMDIKYHCFISSLSGCYITLGKNPKLSFTQKEQIDGKKAFEIGTCKKCSSLYIIGIEDKHNNILLQNNLVNIYENYDDDKRTNVDFFILEDELENIDDINDKKITKYSLCTICAKLVDADTAYHAKRCEHDSEDKVFIYKVNKEKSKVKNNLTSCPICNQRSNTKLIQNINMGKDSATALITQIFFEAVDKSIIEDNKKEYTKQILAFSDSRQEAAFCVSFAEKNHHRFLRKRLLVEILKDKDSISFEDAESRLDALIKSGDLFGTIVCPTTDDRLSSTKQTRITLLQELLLVDGINSGEGLGLYYFSYQPVKELTSKLDDKKLNDILKSINITNIINITEFNNYLEFIINYIRTIPAIYYNGLTEEDKEQYLGYRMFDNSVSLTKQSNVKNAKNKDISDSIKALISNSNDGNKLEKYTQIIFDIDKKQADDFIQEIWDILIQNKILKLKDEKNQLYEIFANKFDLDWYINTKWFYCTKCLRVTRFNIKTICPYCYKNSLEKVDPDKHFKNNNNYYRHEYLNKKIEKLVFLEHTAQLSSNEARKRQNEFRNKEINFLGCSTTFEMGVDIGSLENVLLRNVPPLPSNYIQRAGRAGRGKDNSAFVLTYCSSNSHDYTYFLNPLLMIDAKFNPPVFIMQNHKIIYRHLLSIALSQFFKNNKEMFKDGFKAFYLNGGFEQFITFLKNKPDSLIKSTNDVLSNIPNKEDLINGKWTDNILNGSELNIQLYKDNLDTLIRELNEIKQELINQNKIKEAANFVKQIEKIENKNNKDFLKELANNNLIPKYGFPTDLVEMRLINDEDDIDKKYELTRDIKVALSEYVPNSEIMVDKEIIVSHYINKFDKLEEQYYSECNKCHKTILKYDNHFSKCPECNEPIQQESIKLFRTPKFGFTGEIDKNFRSELKPKKSYSSPLKYVGNGKLDKDKIEVNEHLQFSNFKDDELLLVNENSFFICEKCGYGFICNNDKEKFKPEIQKEHKTAYSKKCTNTKLIREALGFSYKTDILKMIFSSLHFENYEQGLSTLYAILEGIALAFDIERNDIDGIYLRQNNQDIFVLFDTVPGGAGHVKRLLNKEEMLEAFKFAYKKVNQKCCDTSCYKCIRNYRNQKYHELLKRELAKDYLDKLIKTF